MSAVFKMIEKKWQDLLKALDTKFENRTALALIILVGTSLLRVDLLYLPIRFPQKWYLARQG